MVRRLAHKTGRRQDRLPHSPTFAVRDYFSSESNSRPGDAASYVVNRLRDRGILAGTDGSPPQRDKAAPAIDLFWKDDADFLVKALGETLAEDPLHEIG